ncbi:MAG TPA: PAS domain-containing protein, partial [Chloroflexota bacterium]|nr:PAS domain-containing protein [Chloroflexota bacterium]
MTPEATFIVDDEQRVREWSSAASTLMRTSEQEAVGRSCFAVVNGFEPVGRAACGRDCRTFNSLRSGNLTASQDLLLRRPDGTVRRVSCHLVALPQISGGALVTLAASRSEETAATTHAGIDGSGGSPGGPVVGVLQELAAVATVST